jgi:protein-export membrane protein SecD
MKNMLKKLILSLLIILGAVALGIFVYKSEPRLNSNFANEKSYLKNHPFRLGLDLSGGSHLIYKADVSAVANGEVRNSMDALRDVIERRVNLFGVSEPIVQTQKASFVSGGEEKLIVDLPGVTDVDRAVSMIGQTPLLEFKVENASAVQTLTPDANGNVNLDTSNIFTNTELTGRYLKRAVLDFDVNTREPRVSLQFNETGTKLFAEITQANVGKMVAIYLDGAPISTPVVREAILNGEAVISGNFTPTEAKQLVGRLNSGALPVPIELQSKQTIGATLGESAINAGVKAGIIGFLIIALFLILWYRLPGIVATISLSIFVIMMLVLFKLIPVTLTAAGIAGFIIAIGIAVDANILTFERVKEELRAGRSIRDAVLNGFGRSWTSIRDSNISTLLGALILFWFGTSLIKGFALTLGMGVLVSLFSAIIISRVFLKLLSFVPENKFTRFLFSSGISSGKIKNN